MRASGSSVVDVPVRGRAVTPTSSLMPSELASLKAYAREGNVTDAARTRQVAYQTCRNQLVSAYAKLGVIGPIEAFRALGWLRIPEESA